MKATCTMSMTPNRASRVPADVRAISHGFAGQRGVVRGKQLPRCGDGRA
jgi:hypothetical protein